MSMYQVSQFRALIDQGLSNSEIARRLKINRATVRKYRSLNRPPIYQPRQASTRENPLSDFEPMIARQLSERPSLSATSIFLFIQGHGYTGSLRTVERRVAGIGEGFGFQDEVPLAKGNLCYSQFSV
jgi:transposase